MIIEGNKIRADEGRAIHLIGTVSPSTITEATLSPIDSPDNWEDCDYGEPVDPSQVRYYAVDLLSAIGQVCGDERYDVIKAALASARLGSVPVWDMLISGMFIPADDPRLAMIRNALVEAELVSDDEFDKILALAASEEPVPESGSAEG